MPIKTSQPLGYTGYYVEKRKTKRVFLKQIAQLIYWESVTHTLEKHYPTGQSTQGRNVYPAIVLLKRTLLQNWYHLSDYGIEEQVNDPLSLMSFCGLQPEDDVTHHSVVCRFRKALNHSGAWEVLLQQINSQLTRHGVLVKQGAISIVDSSVTPTLCVSLKGGVAIPWQRGKSPPLDKTLQPGVEQEARWGKNLPFLVLLVTSALTKLPGACFLIMRSGK